MSGYDGHIYYQSFEFEVVYSGCVNIGNDLFNWIQKTDKATANEE